MPQFSRRLTILSMLILSMAAPMFAQQSTPAASPLDLARAGRSEAAWTAWTRLPAGHDKLRTGIEVAAVLGDIARGLTLYEQLREDSQSIVIDALHPLALSVAAQLAAASVEQVDAMAMVTACRGALRIDSQHAPCRRRLESLATEGAGGSRAFALYALADVGQRPFPALFKTYEPSLGAQTRLVIARQFRGLPAVERLALVQSLLADRDVSVQYQTLLVLGFIDHPGARLALASFDATMTPLRYARAISLAQHGDEASLDAVREMLDGLDNSLKVPAGLALARVSDTRGALALNEVLASPVDADRVTAAEAIAELSPQTAQPAILEAIHTGSPAARGMALQAAGAARLGANRAVYARLTSTDAQERALAVAAIADTGTSPAAEAVPAPAPRP